MFWGGGFVGWGKVGFFSPPSLPIIARFVWMEEKYSPYSVTEGGVVLGVNMRYVPNP